MVKCIIKIRGCHLWYKINVTGTPDGLKRLKTPLRSAAAVQGTYFPRTSEAARAQLRVATGREGVVFFFFGSPSLDLLSATAAAGTVRACRRPLSPPVLPHDARVWCYRAGRIHRETRVFSNMCPRGMCVCVCVTPAAVYAINSRAYNVFVCKDTERDLTHDLLLCKQ